jgi:hypothetical protein
VCPGGAVVVSDLAADRDRDAAAWREEIERLRDPSHWACLTPERLREAGATAGLVVEDEEIAPVDIDFDDWLARGSNGRAAAGLISTNSPRALRASVLCRAKTVGGCSSTTGLMHIRFRQVRALRCADGSSRLPAHDHGVPGPLRD